MSEKIVQVSGFNVDSHQYNPPYDYLIVGVTNKGTVLITTGDGEWSDITPKPVETQEDASDE